MTTVYRRSCTWPLVGKEGDGAYVEADRLGSVDSVQNVGLYLKSHGQPGRHHIRLSCFILPRSELHLHGFEEGQRGEGPASRGLRCMSFMKPW